MTPTQTPLAKRAERLTVGQTSAEVSKILGGQPLAVDRSAAGFVAAAWRENAPSGWIACAFDGGQLIAWAHVVN